MQPETARKLASPFLQVQVNKQLIGFVRTQIGKWGGRPRLSGWACGPRIVMKTWLEGGQSCPQPAFSRLLAAVQFSITYGGFSTVQRVSRPASTFNGLSVCGLPRWGQVANQVADW